MSNRMFSVAAQLAVLVVSSAAWASAGCPANVTDAAVKAFPGAKVTSCKQEKEHGKVQFEVKLDTKDAKKMELDISPEGSVLLTEEKVPVETVPPVVMTAFGAKYPKAKAEHAEKQTKPDGTITYELAWTDKGKRHEATFGDDGKFVDEE